MYEVLCIMYHRIRFILPHYVFHIKFIDKMSKKVSILQIAMKTFLFISLLTDIHFRSELQNVCYVSEKKKNSCGQIRAR